MKIFLVTNSGAGFANEIDVKHGTTVGQIFDERVNGRADDFLIRLNCLPVSCDHVLNPGDRLTATPVRIEGANG